MTVYQLSGKIHIFDVSTWVEGGENIILIITPRGLEADSLQDKFRDASSFYMYVKYCLWL